MKIILFFILLLLIGLALYQFLRIREYKVIGHNLVKKTQAFSAHPPNATKRILIVGDSLAVGVGSSDPNHSIAGRISADYPDIDITNVAVSGARVEDITGQLSSFQKEHFDLIIIQIGGNNVTHFTPLKTVRADAHTMMQSAKTISPHVIVWSSGSAGFAPIFVPPLSWAYTVRTKKVYITISEVVTSEGGTYVDLYVPWKEDVFKTDTKRYYAADKFHVADDAYGFWYEKIKPIIAKVL